MQSALSLPGLMLALLLQEVVPQDAEPSAAPSAVRGSTLGLSAALAQSESAGASRPLLVLGDPARNGYVAVPLGSAEPLSPVWSAQRLLGTEGWTPYAGRAIAALPDAEGRARARLAVPFAELEESADATAQWRLALVDVQAAVAGERPSRVISLGAADATRHVDVFARALSEDLGLAAAAPGAQDALPTVGRDRVVVTVSTGFDTTVCRTHVWVIAADEGCVVAEREFEGDAFTAGEPISWVPDLNGDRMPDLALGLGLTTQPEEGNRLLLLDGQDLGTLHTHPDPLGPGRAFGAAIAYLGRDEEGRELLAVGAPVRRARRGAERPDGATPGDAAVEVYSLADSGGRLDRVVAFSSAVASVSPALRGVFPLRLGEQTVGWTAASGVAFGTSSPWLAISEPKVMQSFETSGVLMGARWVGGRVERWFRGAHQLGTPREMEWDLGYRIQAFAAHDAIGGMRRIVVATTANPTLREARVVVVDGDDGSLLGEYCVLD